MAALAAVCAHEDGAHIGGRDDLSRYLLDHERRYWHRTAVPAETIEATVFIATLFGPLPTRKAAQQLLRRANLADSSTAADRILTVYDRLYPGGRDPTVGQQSAVLPPLRPNAWRRTSSPSTSDSPTPPSS